ncbi:echinoderm microtubule-associated protein-like 2 [Ctenocephalides felis]|uniref:echinoderm microtubule-associated protein-like 2 n=1 Tax=Ctenocephalides felis TaxID=7515 RepID=UPI000E6E581B|nr:echinoderm microtubule-associated protein-like 2 [Ctenocephalides felis]
MSELKPIKMKPGNDTTFETDYQYLGYTDEMTESDEHGLLGRVMDLERKVLSQEDELVCLRSTLADMLRRLNRIDNFRSTAEANGTTGARNVGTNIHSLSGRNSLGSAPPRTPNIYQLRPQRSPSASRTLEYHNITNNHNEHSKISVNSNSDSNLMNRRSVHYHQSTTSLHSDSPSSSSASPAPSPSPGSGVSVQPPSLRAPPPRVPRRTTASLGKRWSSTGDFGAAGGNSSISRFNTKSLLNLYGKPTQNGTPSRSCSREASYNEEDGTVRFFLRSRPISVQSPTDQQEGYDISQVKAAPSKKLKLDWVYGYRGRDCRSNLYLLPTGEMVYFVAATVVLFDVDEQSQRHYLGHTDDIKSLAVHPNKLLVATGQCAGHNKENAQAHIRVWNSVSLATMAVIGSGEIVGSVVCLSFSRADGGAMLCSVDDSPDHAIAVWEWQKGENGQKITQTKCSVDTVVSAEFHPLDLNRIITCGKNHIAFWTLDNGCTLYKKMGVFENREKPKYVTSVAFNQAGDVITGDSNGNIIVWGRGTNTISHMIRKVHEGSIFSICALKDGGLVTGGGKDGRLVTFDDDLNQVSEEQVEGHFGGVRVVSEGRGTQLLIGTTRNCILTGPAGAFQPAVMGHTDELWALATHPTLTQFVTAGQDCLLQMWDSLSHSVVWSKDIGEKCQSCTFSPDGSVIVCGTLTGEWHVYDSVSRDLITKHHDGQEPIQCVAFSPDGTMLALGSRDNYVYVYQVSEECRKYSRVGRCAGHSSFVTHLDWSADGQYIRSNSGDYEILYWNPSVCRQVTSSSNLRDVQWATHNCVLAFNSIGIWPEGADGTDINSCARSNDEELLATADDFGKVNLYSYPASQLKSLCHSYGGHSSHVTSVRFLFDDSRLISLGGNDTSVLQWSIE